MAGLKQWFADLDDNSQNFITGLLGILIFFSTVMFFFAIQLPTEYRVSPGFTAGKILNNGTVTENMASAYTKDLIECNSFSFKVDYGEPLTVTVHYYDSEGRWLASDTVGSNGYLAREYGSMSFQLEDGVSVEAAGIRLCITKKSSAVSFSKFELLTLPLKFELKISNELPPDYQDTKFTDNLRFYQLMNDGTGKSDALVGRYISFVNTVECSAFRFKLDEPSKYTAVVHFYHVDLYAEDLDGDGKKDTHNWLGCQYVDNSGVLNMTQEEMAALGANAINICFYRDDLSVMDFPDDLTWIMSPNAFRHQFDLLISTKSAS